MDWLRSDDAVWDKNMNIMDFTPSKNKALVVTRQASRNEQWSRESCIPIDGGQTELHAREYILQSDEDWQDWLDSHAYQHDIHTTSKIELILGARFDTGGFDPEVLSYLPFSESLFRQLRENFKIHGTIARTINRNTSCAFIRKFHAWDSPLEQSIVYNCRSTASWQGDLGLSVTFTPRTLTTKAIIFGCDAATTENIISRLSNSDIPELHPMVLVVLFAELERDRLDRLVRNKISHLITQIIRTTEKKTYTLSNRNSSTLSPSLATSIKDWLEMGDLRNGLQAFKRKMQDMIAHADELETLFDPENDKINIASDLDPEVLSGLRDAGSRIKERLKHLVDEFDEHITKCATIIDGVGLASQLEWNQIGREDTFTNIQIAHNGLKVAQHTRRDSELMKSIALLTMVFLPATFVATLFSMGIFEWKGLHGEILSVSPYIWLYVAVTVAITSVTLGVWYLWVMRRRVVVGEDVDVEAQREELSEKGTLSSGSITTT